MSTPHIKDKYYITYGIFYLLGILTFIPNYFVINANRFRFMGPRPHPDEPHWGPGAPDERNVLQASFPSSYYILSQLSLIAFIMLTAAYSKKLPPPDKRISAALLCTLVFYVVNLIFCNLVTDNFQVAFFFLVMIIACSLGVCGAVILVSLFEMVRKFPAEYYTAILTGQALCGAISALIQILTISATDIPIYGGLIFFGIDCQPCSSGTSSAQTEERTHQEGVGFASEVVTTDSSVDNHFVLKKSKSSSSVSVKVKCGTLLVLVTIAVYWYSKRNSQYFIYNITIEATFRHRHFFPRMWTKIKSISKETKMCVSSLIIVVGTTAIVYPGFMSLVVAQESTGKTGSTWVEMYFVPVITFLVASLCDLCGRLSAARIRKPDNQLVILVIAVLRMVFLPLITVCNAQPRVHFPVVFYDIPYVLLTVVFSFSNGYLINLCVTLVPTMAQTEEEKCSVTIMAVISAVLSAAISSFLSLVLVHTI